MASMAISLYIIYEFVQELKKETPDAKLMLAYESSVPSIVYSVDGYKIGEIFEERRYPKSLKQINPTLINAFLAAEDANFYEHSGIDKKALFRAGMNFIFGIGQKQGGSTITQQLAKSVLLSRERTLKRKIKDIILAQQIESMMTKDQILEMYLNTIFLGNNSYGVESAAKNYFRKSNIKLTLGESAMIAGLTPAPSSYAPTTNLSKAKIRQKFVLEQMLKLKYISAKQLQDALKETPKVHLASSPNTTVAPYFFAEVNKQLEAGIDGAVDYELLKKGGFKIFTTLNLKMQSEMVAATRKYMLQYQNYQAFKGPIKHYKSQVWEHSKAVINMPASQEEEEVVKAIVLDLVPNLDLAVVAVPQGIGLLLAEHHRWALKTMGKTVEKGVQDFANILKVGDQIHVQIKNASVPGRVLKSKEFKNSLESINQNLALNSEDSFGMDHLEIYELSDKEGIEVAALIMNPENGGVHAMVGGTSFQKNQFNHATQAKRQVGSSVKPLYYTLALDRGYGPATKIDTPPIVLGDWRPENYTKEFSGRTILRTSLVHSYNISSIQIFQALGSKGISELFKKLGLAWPKEDLSIALGSGEATLLQMVSAYTPFANKGTRVLPRLISRIENQKGEVILDTSHPNLWLLKNASDGLLTTQGANKFSPHVSVFSPGASYVGMRLMQDVINYGTGSAAQGVPGAAGKTGTTNRYSDSWFLGVTPELAAGVWFGFDDQRKSLGSSQGTGGKMAAPLWRDLVLIAQKTLDKKKWVEPKDLAYAKVNPQTGDISLDGGGMLLPMLPGSEPNSSTLKHILGFSAFDSLSSLEGGVSTSAPSAAVTSPISQGKPSEEEETSLRDLF